MSCEGYVMSDAEQREVSTSGRKCRGCGVLEHPATPFTGGYCDRCCVALAAGAVKAGEKATQGSERASRWSLGRVIGVLLMIVGVATLINFLMANTSIQLGPEFGGQRVH